MSRIQLSEALFLMKLKILTSYRPFKAVESSFHDNLQEASLQMRKRKASLAQVETTPHKKNMPQMSPATETLQYHDVKTSPSSPENLDLGNTILNSPMYA